MFDGFDIEGIEIQFEGFCCEQCQFQMVVVGFFVFCVEDWVVFVEVGEQVCQIVEVGVYYVWCFFVSDYGEGFFKLQQVCGQLSFVIFGDDYWCVDYCVFVDVGFVEYGEYVGIGILYIWCGVVFECQYIILVEDVVGGVVF